MKKRISIYLFTALALSTMIILSGCVQKNNNNPPPEPEKVVGADVLNVINEDMSFVLTKDGVKKAFTDDTNSTKVHYYFDILCGDCQRVEEHAGEWLKERVLKGEMEIWYHPTYYIDTAKKPETMEVRNARREQLTYDIVYSAYANPTDSGKVFDTLLTVNNAIKNKEATLPREEFEKVAFEKLFEHFYDENVYNENRPFVESSIPVRDALLAREDLKEISHKEKFFVPFIYVDGEKTLDGENEDVLSFVIEPLKNSIICTEDCE